MAQHPCNGLTSCSVVAGLAELMFIEITKQQIKKTMKMRKSIPRT